MVRKVVIAAVKIGLVASAGAMKSPTAVAKIGPVARGGAMLKSLTAVAKIGPVAHGGAILKNRVYSHLAPVHNN